MMFRLLVAFFLLSSSADAAGPSKEERTRQQTVAAMEQILGSMERGSRPWADLTRRLGDYAHGQAEAVAQEGGDDAPWRARAVAAWKDWLSEADEFDSHVPGVLLSLGDEQAKLGDAEAARRSYTRITAEWEESPEAATAAERLRSLAPAKPAPAASEGTGGFKEGVRAALTGAAPVVERCYEAALRARPDLRGKVIVSFSVDAAGKVQDARVKESSLSDAGVESCVVGQVQAITFPARAGGEPVPVTFPFVFEPR